MTRFAKHLRHIFLAVGAILFALLIRKIGITTILEDIRDLRWCFIPILCISGASYVLFTAAWMQFLHRLSDGIGFVQLFRIKIAGEAINTITPANFIGGDPMRIYLLRKDFPISEGAASVVVDRTLHSIATLFLILLGIIVAFLTFDHLSANIKFGVPIVLVVSSAFMGFVLVHQRRGLFGLVLHLCRRCGIKRNFSERTVRRFMELDRHIVDFYASNHRGFLLALSYNVLGRLLSVAETYAIGRVMSDDFTLFAALMLSALAPIVNAVFTFVPGAIGVMEGASGGLLYLLHMDPALGVTIQIAKRLRSLFWILLGLIFLGAHDRHKVWDEHMVEEEAEALENAERQAVTS
jgi:uncharacterized protein (TIRG00374 family)